MNVFQYAATAEHNWKLNLEDMGAFRPQYTFYSDFSIADWYGESSVRDTYKNVINSWGGDYKALTEIVMVLNHKAWAFDCRVDSHYLGARCTEEVRLRYIKVYTELYNKADAEFRKRYKDNKDAMRYYYEVTD